MKRALFAVSICCLLATATAVEPVQRLHALLPEAPGQPTTIQWELERARIKEGWERVLGDLPETKPPLETRVLASETLAGFRRHHVEYQVEPGLFIDGYLLEPAKTGRLPAVVVFHATTEFGPRGPAGLEPAYAAERQQGVHLVQQGYVTWCPRNYINTPGTNWAGNAALVQKKHPRWTGMTRMTWDALRAADFMLSLPNVDPERLACFGHSLGAKQVLYAMAFDSRYKAGVFSEGGIGTRFSNWDAIWYLGPGIREETFQREHHELLALAAPRPFLLLAGDSADTDHSGAFVDAVRPIYRLYGKAANLRFVNHHKGHPYGAESRALAERFLSEVLAP